MDTLETARAKKGLDGLLARVDTTRRQVNDKFSYCADPATRIWETTPDGDWCGGHWIGLLWLAAETDDPDDRARYESAAWTDARTAEDEMPATTIFRGLTLPYPGSGATTSRAIATCLGWVWGTDDMLALYNGRARQIPLGEFGLRCPANFSGPETNVPAFRDVAVSHTDRHLD